MIAIEATTLRIWTKYPLKGCFEKMNMGLYVPRDLANRILAKIPDEMQKMGFSGVVLADNQCDWAEFVQAGPMVLEAWVIFELGGCCNH